MAKVSTAQILKKIGCDKLALYKGEGYWYFVYDDVAAGIWEDHSVYCMYLSQLPESIWVEEGLALVNKVKGNSL